MAQRAGDGADAAGIAEAIVALCEQVGSELAPIIGQRGVAALYTRSLYLATAAHPWLELQAEPQGSMDLSALKTAIAGQPSADAAAGGVAVLQTFHALLTSLIGASLTDRLLDAVWVHHSPSSGSPAQDSSS